MNFIDIIFLVLLAVSAFKGYSKGFVVEILSFIAFFVGLFVAIELTIPVAERFFSGSGSMQFVSVAVFIGLFIGVVIVINLIAKGLKKFLDLTLFGFLDNILGALAGMFKWVFVFSVLIWVFDSIGFRFPDAWMAESFFFPLVQQIGPTLFEWMGFVLPFIQDMIDSLKNIGNNSRSLYTFL